MMQIGARTIALNELDSIRRDHDISSVARTVSLAFSPDPLIRWLRPNALPWSQLDGASWKWQYRRVQRVMLEGQVLRSAGALQMARMFPHKIQNAPVPAADGASTTTPEKVAQVSASEEPDPSLSDADAGAVVFFFPPKDRMSWSLSRLLLSCKLWLLDMLNPARDSGANDKRLAKLLGAHEASLLSLQTKYPRRRLWYLEVVAVHPALQSRGLGGGVMKWILEHVEHDPVYLECTRQENIKFYEGFGFRVAEEVELTDDEAKLKYWVMIRSDDDSEEAS
ncbi:hypothetical protein N7510_007295 [Penicillium lagena]|uniref:uncharacterized protein n=1 Tax=Penicillium lagena TaxID=94218 RepID=UPI002540E4DA|nr:uncharacterized protein N7510_007295 [Penicillium lagena]KAJ5610576.1 hypothetical protein N7510_007295 [Penicillium lagena]